MPPTKPAVAPELQAAVDLINTEFVSVPEAFELLGMPIMTIRRRMDRVRWVKVAGSYRLFKADLEQLR